MISISQLIFGIQLQDIDLEHLIIILDFVSISLFPFVRSHFSFSIMNIVQLDFIFLIIIFHMPFPNPC